MLIGPREALLITERSATIDPVVPVSIAGFSALANSVESSFKKKKPFLSAGLPSLLNP